MNVSNECLYKEGREGKKASQLETRSKRELRKKRVLKRFKSPLVGFPGGAVVKNPPAKAGDMGSSPGPGRSHMPQSN